MITFSFPTSSTKALLWSLLLAVCWLGIATGTVQGQTDSLGKAQHERVKKESEKLAILPKDPKKATLLSAVVPGAGQVYNGKSWKVPILYAGILTDLYFVNYNHRRYESFRDALFALDKKEPNQFPSLNRAALVRNVDYWRQNRDLTLLLLVGIYALNLVDANVDAHLSGFDISEDLALQVAPQLGTVSASNSMGVSLTLRFK
ncbi:MAG: DUF5683 domain-containing protein [Algoriphagus sp.]|nr:DUF5683 domain-containing protein [Algoriphagus sp.]